MRVDTSVPHACRGSRRCTILGCQSGSPCTQLADLDGRSPLKPLAGSSTHTRVQPGCLGLHSMLHCLHATRRIGTPHSTDSLLSPRPSDRTTGRSHQGKDFIPGDAAAVCAVRSRESEAITATWLHPPLRPPQRRRRRRCCPRRCRGCLWTRYRGCCC